MKNKFCTIFLFFFAVYIFYYLFIGVADIFNFRIPYESMTRKLLIIIFLNLTPVFASVQVIVGFVNKLRWSARILGMYPIFNSVLTSFISTIIAIRTFAYNPEQFSGFKIQYMGLASRQMGIYLIILGVIQLSLFLWVIKDLSRGHYLKKG
jgi:hypothetical protein